MADFLVSNSMLMLEKAMNFQWTKQSTILNNVVNADTPGYKTKYVTFEEALRSSLRSARMGSQPLSSMRSAISSASPAVHTADDETAHRGGAQRLSAELDLPGHQQRYEPPDDGNPRPVIRRQANEFLQEDLLWLF